MCTELPDGNPTKCVNAQTVSIGVGAPASPSHGPYGALTATSLGPVKVGATERDVQTAFGVPDKKESVSLNSSGPAPQSDWIWHYGDGMVDVQFETANHTVTGFTVSTRAIRTQEGFAVGNAFSDVQARYGRQLRRAPSGTDVSLLSAGSPGTYPALMFATSGGVITEIDGGNLQAAGD